MIDHIEWDLHSHLTPEEFAIQLCADLGLSGEAPPLVAHAIHEELIKHKRDAIEWGVVGGDYDILNNPEGGSNLSLLKDKTGLGLGWGRTPRDGRGPKTLRSAWRDWAEIEEFRTKFEVLTADEVERREMERDRATRFVVSARQLLSATLTDVLGSDDCGERHQSFRRSPGVGGSGDAAEYIHTSFYYKRHEKRFSQSEVNSRTLTNVLVPIQPRRPPVHTNDLFCVERACVFDIQRSCIQSDGSGV